MDALQSEEPEMKAPLPSSSSGLTGLLLSPGSLNLGQHVAQNIAQDYSCLEIIKLKSTPANHKAKKNQGRERGEKPGGGQGQTTFLLL